MTLKVQKRRNRVHPKQIITINKQIDMAFKMKAGKEGPMRKNFPSAFKKKGDPTVEEQIAAAEKQFGEGVEVKKSDKLTQRDILAKQASSGRSGTIKPGMEQAAKSKDYDTADKYMASKGNKDAKELIRKKAKKTAEVKKVFAKNPDMTQKEIDKAMSQQ